MSEVISTHDSFDRFDRVGIFSRILETSNPGRGKTYSYMCDIREDLIGIDSEDISPYTRSMLTALDELEKGLIKSIIAPVIGLEDENDKELLHDLLRSGDSFTVEPMNDYERVDNLLNEILSMAVFQDTVLKRLTPTSARDVQHSASEIGHSADDPELSDSLELLSRFFIAASEENKDRSLSDAIDEEIANHWEEIKQIISSPEPKTELPLSTPKSPFAKINTWIEKALSHN